MLSILHQDQLKIENIGEMSVSNRNSFEINVVSTVKHQTSGN